MTAASVLKVENLSVQFQTYEGLVRAVRNVSFEVRAGETFGIIGESGSGKSVTSMAVMDLVREPGYISQETQVFFESQAMSSLSPLQKSRLKGQDMAMIFQDAMTSLNPYIKIGTQMIEGLLYHQKVTRAQARAKAVELLEFVQVPDAAMRLEAYPHELSGGLRQRVMIAMALMTSPKLIFADEPTTALDVTVQAQILKLFRQVRDSYGSAMVLISHDLAVIGSECDAIAVMYAGQIVEQGLPDQVLSAPKHPYTQGLLESVPSLDTPPGSLLSIEGGLPDLKNLPLGCSFQNRCAFATEECRNQPVPLRAMDQGHKVRCLHPL